MRPEENINESIRKLHLKASDDLDKRVHEDISNASAESRNTTLVSSPLILRTIVKTKTVKFAAAVIILAVVGGMTFWPGYSLDGKKWWLSPPAAWSREILAALNEVKGVTCREQIVYYDDIGTEHTSMTWHILYVSRDSKRKDIYDRDFLREIQWYVPDGDGTRHHSIRFDLKSYFTHTGGYRMGDNDPVNSLRSRVSLMDEADRLLGTEVIDGCECVGFEISASKFSRTPGQRTDCIWFDVETKMPVRIEHHGMPVTGSPDETITIVQDQFDYNPGLSADTFIPYIPEGFVFGHPDDILAAREKEQKE